MLDVVRDIELVLRGNLVREADAGRAVALLLTGWPGKMSISEWWPRLMTCSSAVPEISRVMRTQREHMMQRSVKSVICSPM